MNNKHTSTVKWFDAIKGYGFLIGPDGEDVFVHYRSILIDGYKTLAEGQEVEYLLVQGDKGWQATEVAPIGSDENHTDSAPT
jgi:CspA family cold shock protein